MKEIFEKLNQVGLVPVIAIENPDDALDLAQALIDGGINCAEITLRTDCAIEAISKITEKYPDMIVGAGTVLSTADVDASIEAGAKFIVSPGSNKEVISYCNEKNIPIIPGVATPSEVEQALGLGLGIVKLFPAEVVGGVKMIKALSAPYSSLKFMPTGGVNQDNLADYLNCKSVIACGGSWMVKKDLISDHKFDEITKLSKEAMEIVKNVREGK